METKIITIKDFTKLRESLQEPALAIKNGDLVVFPTETVYGIGGDATNSQAIRKIFEVKGRPSDNPLIVHISNLDWLHELTVNPPEIAFTLGKRFWPGPLTMVLQRSENIAKEVTKGLPTVAIRFPNHIVAQTLIDLAATPIAAPSANISGKPSATSAEHAYLDFKGKVPYIIDAGRSHFGIESTVINILEDPPVLLRPGSITLEELQQVIPTIRVLKSFKDVAVVSPGMKYRHYSPDKPVVLIENAPFLPVKTIERFVAEQGEGCILYCCNAFHKHKYPNTKILGETPEEIQYNLFYYLRYLDNSPFKSAVIEGVIEKKEGLAIMNRLRKAASKIVSLQ